VPTSATLIYGERDAVLVDAFLTVEQMRGKKITGAIDTGFAVLRI
jgi:hypothetical protein